MIQIVSCFCSHNADLTYYPCLPQTTDSFSSEGGCSESLDTFRFFFKPIQPDTGSIVVILGFTIDYKNKSNTVFIIKIYTACYKALDTKGNVCLFL